MQCQYHLNTSLKYIFAVWFQNIFLNKLKSFNMYCMVQQLKVPLQQNYTDGIIRSTTIEYDVSNYDYHC